MSGKTFICDKCGICCTKLHLNSLYSDLHEGTGVCRHYNQELKLCSIYENRPDKCDVMKMYTVFQDSISLEQYIKINKIMCEKLRGL